MTLLQLLDFLHLELFTPTLMVFSAFFWASSRYYGVWFDNFLPLTPRKIGVHTFLQKSPLIKPRLFREEN